MTKQNIVIVNGCPMCLAEEETEYHLLIHLGYAAMGNAKFHSRDFPSMEGEQRYISPEDFMESFFVCGFMENLVRGKQSYFHKLV